MIKDHLEWVASPRRLALYRKALAAALPAGAHVLDLGCGTGVLGKLALENGAGVVTCVDETELVEVARRSAKLAGNASRTRFCRTNSAELQLEALADAVICDHVGYFGFDYGIVPLLADARRRLLVPGGMFMPRRLRLMAAPIAARHLMAEVDGWAAEQVDPCFHWIRSIELQRRIPVEAAATDLLAPPVALCEIDLTCAEPGVLDLSATWQAHRAGDLDGVIGWFEAELSPGIWMTNSPADTGRIDRPQALMACSEPAAVTQGDRVEAKFRIDTAGTSTSWTIRVPHCGHRTQHSTLARALPSLDALRRSGPGHRPVLSTRGTLRRRLIELCDGTRTRAEIEALASQLHVELGVGRVAVQRQLKLVLDNDTE